jgi:hypothetical protein
MCQPKSLRTLPPFGSLSLSSSVVVAVHPSRVEAVEIAGENRRWKPETAVKTAVETAVDKLPVHLPDELQYT